jgi:prolyl oligopeptidase
MYQIKESNQFLFECYDVFNSVLYVKDINSRKKAELIKEFNQSKIESIKLDGSLFYYINSSYKTNNGNLMSFDIETFKETVVIPESTKILNSATLNDKMLVVEYVDEKLNGSVAIYDAMDFSLKNEMIFSNHGELKIYSIDDKETEVDFRQQTIEQSSKYKYDFKTNKFKLIKKKKTLLSNKVNVKYANYKSFDGERIPYFHITKKGTVVNENTPTIIYGYGGFMDNNIPYYETIFSVLIDMGCAIVYPCIRGGGEKGFKWGKAGSAFNKMTTIRDYVECAKFLIRNKKSSPEKLIAFGISHGGFVVASALNIAPELFKGCIPIVGLLDIYHYEKNHFIADNWIKEFGRKDNKRHDRALKKVCPLQNVEFQEKAPSILAIAGTHDSRVAPEQIYKYINKMELLNFHHNDKIILENVKNQGHFCHSDLSVKRKIITFIVNELEIF